MKKLIQIFTIAVAISLMFGLNVAATDTEVITETETEAMTEVIDTEVAETVTETVDETVTENKTEVITEGTPLSEIILSVAGELGITFEEAQELVANALVLGEKYFAESDIWALIVEDVQENPARWTLLAVAFLIILSLIGILIKRVLNDAVTNQKMKMALEGISKALFGDEDGDGTSIKAMIAEKNEQIETLKTENAEQQKQIASLEEKATQLAEAIKALIETVGKVESNSDTSLKLSEETALQILQLLNIAMDRKVPITTAEARQIWYEHTQNRIKTIYEEGLGNGKNKDEQEV
jgi:hypothetical protein